MAKWADFIITGVWFAHASGFKKITHVMLHTDEGDSIAIGRKTTEQEAIRQLKNHKSIVTATWNYKNAGWNRGEDVDYVTTNGVEYLRTHRNEVKTDNLDNLIAMSLFGI